DARNLPFADAHFDVVMSNAALHNIYDAAQRQKAVREIIRVLKPGGRCIISDIRHLAEYADILRQNGCTEVRPTGSRLVALLGTVLTFGSLQPGTVQGRKAVG